MIFKKYIKAELEKRKLNENSNSDIPEIKNFNDTDDLKQKNTEYTDEGKYFNMKDPDTGERYDIPLLAVSDPNYFGKYVSYMKMKEKTPEIFKRIMNWE